MQDTCPCLPSGVLLPSDLGGRGGEITPSLFYLPLFPYLVSPPPTYGRSTNKVQNSDYQYNSEPYYDLAMNQLSLVLPLGKNKLTARKRRGLPFEFCPFSPFFLSLSSRSIKCSSSSLQKKTESVVLESHSSTNNSLKRKRKNLSQP